MEYPKLNRQQIKDVIDGRCNAGRIPMMYHIWSNASTFGEDAERAGALMRKYPYDVLQRVAAMPGIYNETGEAGAYCFLGYKPKPSPGDTKSVGLDTYVHITDFEEEIDLLVQNMPDAEHYPYLFDMSVQNTDDSYSIVHWWYCLFERHWSLRGMENALTDFYLYPAAVHKLYRALTDFYKQIIVRAKKELNVDGILTSDDIGTQNATFFSPEIFREFFKPYYKELIDCAHENDMHFWLHTCGNIENFLPDFIEIGLDVIHPIQKYTMDERKIAALYGDKICIWAGFDVQQTIPYGTPEDVRKEVRFMIDTYARRDGRFMLTCGNALTPDCGIGSFEALLDESYAYGTKKCNELNG